MKWDFKIVVLLVEWSSFGVVLKLYLIYPQTRASQPSTYHFSNLYW